MESDTEEMSRKRQKRDEICEEVSGFASEESFYHMPKTKKGILVIFSIDKFTEELNIKSRNDTGKDVDNLTKTFEAIGFKVISYKDTTSYGFREECFGIAKRQGLEDMGCLAVAILTHWKKDGYFYASDGEIQIDTISRYFDCDALVGKPKLFFIQACRGREVDYRTEHQKKDAEPIPDRQPPCPIKLAMKSDFFYAYSTAPGYCSSRHPSGGSWFIQLLCESIERHAKELDLLSIMTRVISSVTCPSRHARKDDTKQIPSIISLLSKDLYFYPKKRMT